MIRRLGPLLVCAAALAQGGRNYVEEIETGRNLYEANRFEEALTHFARARTLAPNDWRGHAFQAFTLLEQARRSKDPRRRDALLREAEQVAGVLVKRRILLFQDPLYKFMRGLHYDMIQDGPRAREVLRQAFRTPRAKFQPYAEIDLRGAVERYLEHADPVLAEASQDPYSRTDRASAVRTALGPRR